MKILMFILDIIFYFPMILEDILAFFLDPILARNKKLEDWMYRKAFDRLEREYENERKG